ncbi:MAG: hypothetical protein FWG63_08555 [Defluviitaleaceae bacterium]|nr:hypothetical protein [Defluviitaleaceae bacterium]
MSDFEIKIKLLTDIIIEKNDLLTIALNITHNQKTLLNVPEGEMVQTREIFAQMTLEKKTVLDKILERDSIFNNVFENLQDFEEKAREHADIVRELQNNIKQTTDLDMQVRLAEEENMSILRKGVVSVAPSPLAKKNVLEKYKSNAKKPTI